MSSSHAFPICRRARSAFRLALCAAAAAAALTAATTASATVVFSDEFNDDAGAFAATSLANWNVVQGNVDVLPHLGHACGAGAVGNCLDLDGTGSPAPAIIETTSSFSFIAGEEYELTFDFRTGTANDSFTVSLGAFFSETFSGYGFPFEVTRTFAIGADGSAPIRFALGPTPNQAGPYLDTVTLTRTADVPAPAAIGLFGLGLLGLGLVDRRKTRRRPARGA